MLEALVAFAQLSGAGLAVTAPAQPITVGYAAEINATSAETFQAEQARRSGGASVNDRYAGYTGSGYVETYGSSGITWTVSVPTSGTYPLKIRYAVGIGNRSATLAVDNKKAKSVTFAKTGRWTTWKEVTFNESLSAGSHTIRLTSTQTRGPSIDRLIVPGAGSSGGGGGGGGGGGTTPPPGGTPTPAVSSATGQGNTYDLSWTNSGVQPDGGFDIIVDGTDTNNTYRTTALSTSVGPLDSSVRHCFAIQARYISQNKFLNSSEVCVDPAPTGGGGGGGGTPTPTLKSATGSGGNYDLVWSNGGVDPAGGFDIIIDGTDTNQANRTIWLETTVGPLDESRTHCFQVQARYTDAGTFPNSNELCVSPSSGGGGGGGGGSQNRAPTISGQPSGAVIVGQNYRFAPTVNDPDGDPVTLSISNKPAWLSFNRTTGVLSGTPNAGDVRTWSNITITASDGQASSTLGPFGITVEQSGNRSVTLSWTPPTKREDGSNLNNLRGYFIYVGQSKNNLDREIKVNSAGVSSYTVDDLTPGTWHLGVKAYDADNVTSAMSTVVSITLN